MMLNILKTRISLLFSLLLLVSVPALIPHVAAGKTSTSQESGNKKTDNKDKDKIRYLDKETDPFMLIDKGENIGDFKDAAVAKFKELSGAALREKKQRMARDINTWAKNRDALNQQREAAKERVAVFKERIKTLQEEHKYTCAADKKERLKLKARIEHAKYQGRQEKRRIREFDRRLEKENTKLNEKLAKKPSTFNDRARGYISNAGTCLSVLDAAKKSYYEEPVLDKDGKPTGRTVIKFSGTAYFYHSMMNLTGLAGITGSVSAAAKVRNDKMREIIEEYKRKNIKVTPEMYHNALLRASVNGLFYGAYSGAKCIRGVGDVIATGELIYSGGMAIKDTWESSLIQAENRKIQTGQNSSALATIETEFRKYKDYRQQFEDIQRDCQTLGKEVQKQRNLFLKAFSQTVELEKEMADTDQLARAAQAAAPFMDEKWFSALQSDIDSMAHSVNVTVKLADTTMESGSSEALEKTSSQLSAMITDLRSYRQQCRDALNVLKPLSEGGTTLLRSNELMAVAEENSGNAMDALVTATDLFRLYSENVKAARELRKKQDEVMDGVRRLISYYHRERGDVVRIQIDTLLGETLQYRIDDYALDKLSREYDSLSFLMRDFREDATRIPEGLPPELADSIALARELAPEIAAMQTAADNAIASAEKTIARMDSFKTQMAAASLPEMADSAATQKYSMDFNRTSLDEIRKYVKHEYKNSGILNKLGYINHAEPENPGAAAPDGKPHPDYSHSPTLKLIENGTTVFSGKRTPYWIWYEIGEVGCDTGKFYRFKSDMDKRIHVLSQRLENIEKFKTPNITEGIIGTTTRGSGDEVAINHVAIAATPPFITRVVVYVSFQIGKTRRTHCLEHYLKASLENPDAFSEKLQKWEAGAAAELKKISNVLMYIPHRYADFEHRYFYTDICSLAPLINMTGFQTRDRQMCNKRKSSITRYYDKTEPLPDAYNSYDKTEIHYGIEMKTLFPDTRESWKDFLDKSRKKMTDMFQRMHAKERVASSFPGADCARISRWMRKSFYNRKISGGGVKRETVYSLNEYFYLLKNNVMIEVSGSGGKILKPEIETDSLARAAISRLKKPPVQ